MPSAPAPESTSSSATAMGLGALAAWSTSIACARAVTEHLGLFTGAAAVYLASGVLSCALLAVRPGARAALARAPRRYWTVCGPLFVAYMVCLYVSVGLAPDRGEAAVVGVINYLWPAMLLVFSIPILGRRARWTLVPGLALALAGVAMALNASRAGSSAPPLQALSANPAPYAFAFGAAVSWGLYSNYCRRYAAERACGVPFFLFATGLLLLALRLMNGAERSDWSPRVLGEWAFVVVFPTTLAYSLWEYGMRQGNVILLGVASFFVPVLSTGVLVVYLGLEAGAWLWIGCVLVTLGAVVCQRSFFHLDGPGVR